MTATLKVKHVMERYEVSRATAYRIMKRAGAKLITGTGCLRIGEDKLAAAMREDEWRDTTESEASGTPGASSPAANGGPSRRARKSAAKPSAEAASSSETFSLRLTYPRGKAPR